MCHSVMTFLILNQQQQKAILRWNVNPKQNILLRFSQLENLFFSLFFFRTDIFSLQISV